MVFRVLFVNVAGREKNCTLSEVKAGLAHMSSIFGDLEDSEKFAIPSGPISLLRMTRLTKLCDVLKNIQNSPIVINFIEYSYSFFFSAFHLSYESEGRART